MLQALTFPFSLRPFDHRSLASSIRERIGRSWKLQVRRDDLRDLAALDSALLKDIGLESGDFEHVSQIGDPGDAMLVLSEIRRQRLGRR